MNQEVFLSFLDLIADHFSNPEVNEIRLNANGSIWEERGGEVVRVPVTVHPMMIEFAVGALSGEVNQPLNHQHPKLDVRMDDGSRIAILAPPLVGPGYAVTIRRFPLPFTMEDFLRNGTVTEQQAGSLADVITQRKTVVISGATRAGKTTIARVLLNAIPHPGEKLILIEQPPELNLKDRECRDITEIEVREETPNAPAFTATDAVKAALRHSPDRIIVGELRGGEALDFLEACNTGHAGSLTTLHANSAADALDRLVTLVRRGDRSQPRDVVVDTIGRAIGVVIHVDRIQGRRVVTEILEVRGPSEDHKRVETRPYEGKGWEAI